MQIIVKSVPDLGIALRAARKAAGVRLDDLADMAGVSKQFVSDVEYGKQTVQLGLVLKLLAEMGLHLSIDLPATADPALLTLRARGGVGKRQASKNQD